MKINHCVKKITICDLYCVFRMMKILLILFMLGIGNAFSGIYSQNTLLSLEINRQSIKEVLGEIEKKSEYVFFFSENTRKELDKKVNIHVVSKTLNVILDQLFNETDLVYTINNRQVSIAKSGRQTLPADSLQQTKKVSGRVVDQEGSPLIGVTILVKGTQQGAITDVNGEFQLTADENAALLFSYVGFENATYPLAKLPKTIVLKEQSGMIEEVVVTGYQTLSRERVTGSFGIISSTSLESKLESNFKAILEGQITGLVLGKDNKVEIRGVSTFSAEKKPLIVVDGFPLDANMFDNVSLAPMTGDGTLENINYDNVASITVLKDAVAASIYGSRAANGVIVISTKNGRIGKPSVSYKGKTGIVMKPRVSDLKLASSSEYIDASVEIFNQSNASLTQTSTSDISRVCYLLMMQRDGLMSEAEVTVEINQLRNINFYNDLEKEAFRNEFSHQHIINMNGGNESVIYNTSINYLNTRGNFIHNSSDRLTFDMKNDFKLSKSVNVSVSTNLTYTSVETPRMAPNESAVISNFFSPEPYMSRFQPYADLYNPLFTLSPYKLQQYQYYDGMKGTTYYLLDDLDKEMTTTANFQSRINGFVRVNIIDGLNTEIGGSWQRGSYIRKVVSMADAFRMRVAFNDCTSIANNANHYFPDGDMIDEVRNINQSWTLRGQANFLRGFNNDLHHVTAIAGYEIRCITYDNNTMATRLGYNSTSGSFTPMNLKDFIAGVYDNDMLFRGRLSLSNGNGSYNYQDNRFVSWYGNSSYEYDNRFIISGSIRLDLTNFFGTDPKYRYKPLWSVGGTWKIAREKFFDVNWINRMDLRASFGVNGNIALDQGPFLILSTGSYNQRTEGVSYGIQSPPNFQLRWEKTKSTNIGLDISFFDSRLDLDVDFYNRLSSDLLAPDNIDQTTGFANITRNVGEIRNRGLEISFHTNLARNSAYRWDVTYNFAYNKNKVLRYDLTRNYPTNYTTGAIEVTGYPASGLWVYRLAPLSDDGLMQVYDKDDNIIAPSGAKPDDLIYGGTTRPSTDVSLTNQFSFKNVDFSFMFIGKFGHKFVEDHFDGSLNSIRNRHVADRWQKAGDEILTIYPKLQRTGTDYFYFPYSDVLLKNASYVKLRDLTLSYTFGKNVIPGLNLFNIKLYLQARNLLTFTGKGVEIDPETVDMSTNGRPTFSIPREFYMGLKITF